jgi:hypothetical protein
LANELAALRHALREQGYIARLTPAGHFEVRDQKTNEPLRHEDGRKVTLPSTPGDHRALANCRAKLKKLGLDTGPQPKREDREMANNTIALERARSERKAKSHVLRERLKALMLDQEPPLSQSDVYHWGAAYAAEHGIHVPGNPQTQLSSFLRGAFLTDDNYAYMSAVVSAIAAAKGEIPRASEGRKRAAPAAEPATLPEDPEAGEAADAGAAEPEAELGIQVEGQSSQNGRRPYVPMLALETMQAIYNRPSAEAVQDLCRRIAEAELKAAQALK